MRKVYILIIVINFANFRSNSIFMQNKIPHLKNISHEKSSHFQQLVVNFANFWQNNGIFAQKKIVHLKYQPQKKRSCFNT